MDRPDEHKDMSDIAEEVERTTDDKTGMQPTGPDRRAGTDMDPTAPDERGGTDMDPTAPDERRGTDMDPTAPDERPQTDMQPTGSTGTATRER